MSIRAVRVMTRVGDDHHGLGKFRRNPRAGQTLVTVAVALVAILALAGIAIDVGMMMLARNEVQNAADAAALSGAAEFYKFSTPPTTVVVTPNWTRAQDTAAKAVTRNKVMNTALLPGHTRQATGTSRARRPACSQQPRARSSPTTGRQSR